jgi:hypothetical protein
MQRRRIGIIAAVVVAAIAVYWWWSGRPVFLPFGSNAFVEQVTITRLTPLSTVWGETTAMDPSPERNRPLEDPIEVSARGSYLQFDLKRYENFPGRYGGRDVGKPDRWVLTFAMYRTGDPQGEGAREYGCQVPQGTLIEDHANPHFGLPVIGHGFGGENFVGTPILELAEPGHNRFWTFVGVAPVPEERPSGEYVYEVRLYPTARWISAVRFESGDPIVLRRGTLIVVEDDGPPADAEVGTPR